MRSCDEASVDQTTEPIRWGNPRGLDVLERMDIELAKHDSQSAKFDIQVVKFDVQAARLDAIETRLASHEADIVALKATTQTHYAVRSRFFAEYKRDSGRTLSPADQDLLRAGNIAAYDGDPVVDAMMFERGYRSDETIFSKLYGFDWQKVLHYGMCSL